MTKSTATRKRGRPLKATLSPTKSISDSQSAIAKEKEAIALEESEEVKVDEVLVENGEESVMKLGFSPNPKNGANEIEKEIQQFKRMLSYGWMLSAVIVRQRMVNPSSLLLKKLSMVKRWLKLRRRM
ncbi:unnamed protein product [Vicia faba]|uniref:Uncharacterized protein n=1 Tax=Vicia faba TaxID=3906 RepID=A0AAV0YHM3_VICFA|nr:unnamed protein product [Vicia faba]